jgi:hypothetical protein
VVFTFGVGLVSHLPLTFFAGALVPVLCALRVWLAALGVLLAVCGRAAAVLVLVVVVVAARG